MSCRVINRGLEHFLFEAFLDKAKEKGVKRICAKYIPSPKNAMVADLYTSFGFVCSNKNENGEVSFEGDIETLAMAQYYIKDCSLQQNI